ncbi:MAG TPA: hypothetical protein VGX48_24610 [Pyrinomonadaceae bacterium]|nr:hypothetical protein [Pyrinomonadaceae bacterium]
MKMNKTEQLLENDALFDDEATVLARPVVPLADAPEEMTVVSAGGQHTIQTAPAPRAARRPWLLGLVLVSALAGAVIGGTALYLIQGRRAAPVQPQQQQQPSAPAQSQQSADVTTPTTAPAENAPQPQTPAPQESHAAPPAEPAKPEQEEQPREAAPRPEPEGQARTDSHRHGRKAEDEDDEDAPPQTAERRRRDGAIDTQAPIPDDYSPTSVRAARVEEALRRIDDRGRGGRRARRVDIYRPQY